MIRTQPIERIAQDDWKFGLSLLPHLGEGNVSVSPTSIRTALSMLYEGATGATAQQIAQAAHISEDEKTRRQGFKALTNALNAVGAPYTLRCANGIWTTKKDPVKETYKKVVQENYSAEANDADFEANSEGERQKINAWVSDKTEKKIPSLFPEGAIDESTILALVNALYFKAPWENKFDEKYTQNQEFTLADGKRIKVPMMRKGTVEQKSLPRFAYAEFDGVQVVQLPYKGRLLATIAFLPPKGTSVRDLETQLQNGSIDFADLPYRFIDHPFARLEIPKHELKGDYDLTKVLKNIGIERIFDQEKAELSGIADTTNRTIYVSSGVHKTYFKTNEEGSEGAAATGFGLKSFCTSVEEPLKIMEFVADRPYLEAIVHPSSGAVLFINRVEDPQ